MSRVSAFEKARAIGYEDTALQKLESQKNISKPHWSTESIDIIYAMLETELKELKIAILKKDKEAIKTELKDIKNNAFFMYDNIETGVYDNEF